MLYSHSSAVRASSKVTCCVKLDNWAKSVLAKAERNHRKKLFYQQCAYHKDLIAVTTRDSELGSVHRRHCHCWRYGWSWSKVDNSLAEKYKVSSKHFKNKSSYTLKLTTLCLSA